MKNENAGLPNRHTLYIGTSGSGKSQCLKQNAAIPKKARVILFDPNTDHVTPGEVRARSRVMFIRSLIELEKTGRAYRLAWTPEGEKREAAHEFFCQCVLEVLDGARLTYVIDEELAQSCKSASKAEPHHKQLINEGRKYGLVYHGAIQIPQRVPKDVYDNCFNMYIGRSVRLPKYVTDVVTVEKGEAAKLEDLEFFKCDQRGAKQKIKIRYRG